jgi:hypothetical protein
MEISANPPPDQPEALANLRKRESNAIVVENSFARNTWGPRLRRATSLPRWKYPSELRLCNGARS